MPLEYQKILEDADFTTPEGLRLAIKAGNALKEATNADIDESLLKMSAVQEQRRKFDKYKEKFARGIGRQLNNLFIHYGNHKGEAERNADGLILPQHNGVHRELKPYTELMHWTKIMERKTYDSLKETYKSSMGKLYERDLRGLFEAAREKINGKIVLFV